MMNRSIYLTYHGTVLSKKNRHITTRQGHIIPDARAKANEDDMINQFLVQLKKQGGSKIFTKTHTERLLEASQKGTAYSIAIHIWNESNRRRDLDNQATSILDALTKSGAIVDDCAKFVRALTVIYKGIDKEDPRAEIHIVEFEGYREAESGTIQS